MTAVRQLPAILVRARDEIEPALEAAVDRLQPELRPAARYHLGWVDANGIASSQTGKRLRSALALLSAECVGAGLEVARAAAVGVELVHEFSLLHDDVMDGDRERRHREAVWALYGVAHAIVLGDALLLLAFDEVDDGGSRGAEAARHLRRAAATMTDGQALDLAFERKGSIDIMAVQDMASRKTAALLACSVSLSALMAGASEQAVCALTHFGEHLGLAYQAIDDLLGIWGDPAHTGKPVAGDLRQGKRTLPIAFAVASGGAGAAELEALLALPQMDEPNLARSTLLIEDLGGRDLTERLAQSQLDLATAALDDTPLASEAVMALRELAQFVVNRDS